MESDKGRYAQKHPGAELPDPIIVSAVKKKMKGRTVSCADAEKIASELGKSMLEIGTALDLLEISINKCQLGLFGYYPQRKIVSPSSAMDPLSEEVIRGKLKDGRLSCAAAWEVAAVAGLPKLAVASACERLGIKIKPCQLGAF